MRDYVKNNIDKIRNEETLYDPISREKNYTKKHC